MRSIADYDMTRVPGITKYVCDCIDDYRRDPAIQQNTVDSLATIFRTDSPFQIKVVDGYELSGYFYTKLGMKRRKKLKEILEIIDFKRYKDVKY